MSEMSGRFLRNRLNMKATDKQKKAIAKMYAWLKGYCVPPEEISKKKDFIESLTIEEASAEIQRLIPKVKNCVYIDDDYWNRQAWLWKD